MHARSPNNATDIHVRLKLPQGLYYNSANRKRHGRDCAYAQARLIFAGHLCDKCPFIIYWLNYPKNNRLNKSHLSS